MWTIYKKAIGNFWPAASHAKITAKHLLSGLSSVAALTLVPASARAQISDDVVKIGIITDMGGPYAAASGEGAVTAVKMAVADFGGRVLGKPIEILVADHQNKPDIAVSTARKWIDIDKVDVIVDLPGSSVALAVQNITREKKIATIIGSAAANDLIGKSCSPTSILYVFDAYSLAKTSAKAAVEKLGKTFFFLVPDNAFGASIEGALTKFIGEAGGKVLGSVRHPIGISDFSSFILQAQASKADVVILGAGGSDAERALKTAHEFGLDHSGQHFLAPVLMDTDVHSVGAAMANGVIMPAPFYRDRTEESKAWSKRYLEKMKVMPNAPQAGAYSYTMNYLKAVQAAGTDDSTAVVEKMKATPIDDIFAKGYIRKDGKFIFDQYLLEVTSGNADKDPWDYFSVIDTVKGDVANIPVTEGGCSFAIN